VIFLWIDFVPIFGVSNNVTMWKNNLVNCFKCFFNVTKIGKCKYNPIFGVGFMFFHMISYVFSTLMTFQVSANFSILISVLPTIIVNIFWYVIPNINQWAGGDKLTNIDLICSIISTVIIVFGLIVYKCDKISKYKIVDTKTNDDDKITSQ